MSKEESKGYWFFDGEEGYGCSECGQFVYGCFIEIYSGEYQYCPRCGAFLGKAEEDDA